MMLLIFLFSCIFRSEFAKGSVPHGSGSGSSRGTIGSSKIEGSSFRWCKSAAFLRGGQRHDASSGQPSANGEKESEKKANFGFFFGEARQKRKRKEDEAFEQKGRIIRLLKNCTFGAAQDRWVVVAQTNSSWSVESKRRGKRSRGHKIESLEKSDEGKIYEFVHPLERDILMKPLWRRERKFSVGGMDLSRFRNRVNLTFEDLKDTLLVDELVETPTHAYPAPPDLSRGSRSIPKAMKSLGLESLQEWASWVANYSRMFTKNISELSEVEQGSYATCRIISPYGALVRSSKDVSSPQLGVLPVNTSVVISCTSGRRAKIVVPVEGWLSLETREGVRILDPCKAEDFMCAPDVKKEYWDDILRSADRAFNA